MTRPAVRRSGARRPRRSCSDVRRMLLLASLVGALAAALAVVMQGAVAAGISGFVGA